MIPAGMSRKGNPYDNVTTESFFKTLKVEEVYLWEYRTLEDVQIRLPFSFRKRIIANACIPLWDTGRRWNLKNCFIKTKNPGRLL
jgi:transposase InsO family protein